jgi:hypothetical protein
MTVDHNDPQQMRLNPRALLREMATVSNLIETTRLSIPRVGLEEIIAKRRGGYFGLNPESVLTTWYLHVSEDPDVQASHEVLEKHEKRLERMRRIFEHEQRVSVMSREQLEHEFGPFGI